MASDRAVSGADPGRVSWPVLVAFGLPSLPMAALAVPLFIYLPPYYVEELGVSLSLVGSLLLLARLWDVVTDPLVGIVSDRVTTPFGRRKPWALLGLPLLLIGVWFLFLPGSSASGGYLLVWSLVVAFGWTVISLPHNAWAAELSPDYHERARIYGVTQAFVIVGTVVGVVLPGLVQANGGSRGDALGITFLFVLATLPVLGLWMIWRVPEPPATDAHVGWSHGFRLLGQNRPFRRLLIAYLINGIANGLPASLFLLYVGAFIGGENSSGILLLTYFGAGFAALPFWLRFLRSHSKHRIWCVAMLLTCLVFATVPLIPPGQFWWFFVVCLLTGTTVGVDLALPASIQADVIDEDTAQSGTSRAGTYFALWGMATKLALALAVGLAYPLLDWAGFEAGEENTRSALLALALLYGGGPVVAKLLAVALMWNFPLTEARQRELREQIASVRDGRDEVMV